MTAPNAPEAAPQGATEPTAPPSSGTDAAIAEARLRLAEGRSLIDPAADTGQSAASGNAPPEDLTIRLDGLEDRGEDALELEVPDPETYERLTDLQRAAEVGRTVKAETADLRQAGRELGEVQEMIAVDPTGFITTHLSEPVRVDVATQLAFTPGVLEAIDERLRAEGYEGGLADVLYNPDARRTLAAELKAQRLEMRDGLRERYVQHQAMQGAANRVLAEVDRQIPASIQGELREQLFQDSVRDISDRCRRLGLTDLDPRDVAMLVSERLRGHQAPGRAPASRSSDQAPVRRAAPAALPAELPQGTDKKIELARKVGLRAMIERARATT